MTDAELHAGIDELWTRTKDGELPRNERFTAIEELTEAYVSANDKRPPVVALDRLATLCLYEEVTDPHPDKMAREETPILSDRQSDTRDRKETKVSEMIYGNQPTIGFRKVSHTDENGVISEKRQRIHRFPK